MSYNYLASQWAAKHFEQDYKAKWIPEIPTMILSGSEDHITPVRLFRIAPQFQRANVQICEIDRAGHFPWIENPAQVNNEFMQFGYRFNYVH